MPDDTVSTLYVPNFGPPTAVECLRIEASGGKKMASVKWRQNLHQNASGCIEMAITNA